MRLPALLLAGVLLTGCSAWPFPQATGGDSATDPATPTASVPTDTAQPAEPAAACTAEAESLSLTEQVGQLIMVGVSVELTSTERSVIRRYRAGSAIVMGTTPSGVEEVAALTSELGELGGKTGMLVAADQEGGLVQRLKGDGFSTIPSAAQQAELTDARLKARATLWGEEMARAGVLLDLAPVADVVPAADQATNEPVALLHRGYGSDPKTVSEKVAAFSEGMHEAGVAVAVKHFPGLGAVRGNTDFATSVVDNTTTPKSKLLAPFEDAATGDADAVMVSSARYDKIDPDNLAMFSPIVIGLLREWGFDRVVISDDLGAAAAVGEVPPYERAAKFIGAGGDLALSVDASAAGLMASGLKRAAKADPELAARVTESAARVLALKASLGLYHCG